MEKTRTYTILIIVGVVTGVLTNNIVNNQQQIFAWCLQHPFYAVLAATTIIVLLCLVFRKKKTVK